MKTTLVVLLAFCATACSDGRISYDRIKMSGAPELRFSGAFNVKISDPSRAIGVTYKGRTIRYEDGALLVDDRRWVLPANARVVTFDGANISVDRRSIDLR